MGIMAIGILLMVIVAVIVGFIGLITIIKGFVNKDDKKIKMGTIFVCIFLFVFVTGVFCTGKHVHKLMKRHAHEREMKMKHGGFGPGCEMEMIKGCMENGEMTKDSNGVRIETKVIMDKDCEHKCDPKTCADHKK